jgi:hypothetical protein
MDAHRHRPVALDVGLSTRELRGVRKPCDGQSDRRGERYLVKFRGVTRRRYNRSVPFCLSKGLLTQRLEKGE